jgi:hypothetical protein
MIVTLVAAALVGQASALPTPSPTATLAPEWVKAPPTERGQYARYVRKDADATTSTISAARQVCDCDPIQATTMIQAAFAQFPGTVVTRSEVVPCGHQASRVIVTGHATAASPESNNLEIIAFRQEPALFSLTYTFKGPQPLPDAEAALLTLCPTP